MNTPIVRSSPDTVAGLPQTQTQQKVLKEGTFINNEYNDIYLVEMGKCKQKSPIWRFLAQVGAR